MPHSTPTPSFFKLFWQLIKPYWRFSNQQWKSWLLLFLIITLNLGDVYMQALFNHWYNGFYNSMQNLDKSAFVKSMVRFSYLAVIFIVMAVYRIYLSQMLTIRWRRWLTKDYLERWTSKQTYYRMQLKENHTDNPDQRISEDVGEFISSTLGLSLGLLNAFTTLCLFVVILWNLSGPLQFQIGHLAISIPGYMVWASLLYALFGTYLTQKIGRPLVPLNFKQQRFEADFRFSLVRFREQSENIAFYQGEKEENKNFRTRFTAVFDNFLQIMRRQKRLTWFTAFYGQAALIFPFLVAAPRLFSKQIQVGGVMQVVDAFGKVQGALSYFVDAYVTIAAWKATIHRLVSFHQRMEQMGQEVGFSSQLREDSNLKIEAKQLNVQLPNGKSLLKNLNFCFQKNETWLITGHSGCGKTTLLRTIAGIWPFASGSLSIPEKTHLLFLPQRIYLPLATFKKAVCYPLNADNIPNERVQEVLQFCQLPHLYDKLLSRIDQSHVLSVGEQQRVGFARAILAKPDFLFLDEATSALDEPSEAFLYQLLRTECPDTCIISVGHRSSLKQWHICEISLDPTDEAL